MDYLTAFDALLAAPDIYASMNPPASVEHIHTFETALAQQERVKGFRLPPSYQAFLLRYDGGSCDDNEAGAYVHFLSVDDHDAPWNALMACNDADSVLMNHEIETYFVFEPLVMIAMDEGGSFWALDPTQKRDDGEMPVRYCDHESGDIYAQSEDFPSFILAIANRQLKYRELDTPIIRGQ